MGAQRCAPIRHSMEIPRKRLELRNRYNKFSAIEIGSNVYVD